MPDSDRCLALEASKKIGGLIESRTEYFLTTLAYNDWRFSNFLIYQETFFFIRLTAAGL